MASSLTPRLLLRAFGIVTLVTGLIGLIATYVLVPTYLRQYEAGLLWCGLLATGGAGLVFVMGRTTRQVWSGRVFASGALAVVLLSIAALIQTGVFLRLWVQAVVRLS